MLIAAIGVASAAPILCVAADDSIPALAELSQHVRELSPGLIALRKKLADEVTAFNQSALRFDDDCGNVDATNQSLVTSCERRESDLDAEKHRLAQQIRTFDTAVSRASNEALAPEIVCHYTVHGLVHIQKADGTTRTLVGSAAHFEIGERITTGAGAEVVLTLPDGSVWTIGPNADLVLDRFVYGTPTGIIDRSERAAIAVFRYITYHTTEAANHVNHVEKCLASSAAAGECSEDLRYNGTASVAGVRG
jgi:hypothetical protein